MWQGLRAHMVCWKDSTPGTYRPSGPLLNDGFSAIRVSAGICVRVHRTARALAAPKALLASPHNRQRRLRRPGAQPDPRARLFDFCLSLQNSGAASSLLKISTPGQDTREPLLHSFLEDVSEYEPGEARTARPGDGTGMGGCRRGRREEGALHGLLGGPRRPFRNAHRGVGFLRWAWAPGWPPSGIMSGLLGATTHCVAAPRRSAPRPARSSQVPPQVPSARMQSLALHSDCVMAPLRHGGATVQ